MAPLPRPATLLEFHEPEITKPQPLRIIKRSQTITACSSPRAVIGISRSVSGITNSSRGSPPMGPDRPLTVRKRRKERGSIFGSSVDEGPLEEMSFLNPLSDLVSTRVQGAPTPSPTRLTLQDDPDLTPKARKPLHRTASTGAFLKLELQRCSSEAHGGHSQLCRPKSCRPLDEISLSRLNVQGQKVDQHSPNVPERRPSKSKSFLYKTLGVRGSQESTSSIRRVESMYETSKGTLLRHFSRVGRSSTSSSLNTDCNMSTETGQSIDSGYATDGLDYGVLAPRVVVTPEVSYAGEGLCIMWVAIEITGVGSHKSFNDCLNSMQVDLVAGQSCFVLEIVGNLYELKSVRLHETHLILAKIRLPALMNSDLESRKDRGTSEELIADLENQLGTSFTSYLTVRLSYEHTAFGNPPCGMNSDCGLYSHTTTLKTEATAYIRRTPDSPWASRNPAGFQNPLIGLIETHYTSEKARDTVRRLSEDRVKIPRARRGHTNSSQAYSSEDTVTAEPTTIFGNMFDPPRQISDNWPPFPPPPPPPICEEDPARKIWTEMRRISRSRHRKTVSHCDRVPSLTPSDQDCSPSRISSVTAMDEERNRIKQTALHNKRSVGADTLRSIAPSVSKVEGGGGSIAGSLGLGRSWRWGGSWW